MRSAVTGGTVRTRIPEGMEAWASLPVSVAAVCVYSLTFLCLVSFLQANAGFPLLNRHIHQPALAGVSLATWFLVVHIGWFCSVLADGIAWRLGRAAPGLARMQTMTVYGAGLFVVVLDELLVLVMS